VNGPSDDVRGEVFRRLERSRAVGFATDSPGEDDLIETLEMLEREIASDVESSPLLHGPALGGEGEAWDTLAAVQAWAGLASAAVTQVYEPASPWPRSMAGWGTRATIRLQGIIKALLGPLQAAAAAISVTPSIRVGFPWGLSVGLSW
jgi:hypothetical protein